MPDAGMSFTALFAWAHISDIHHAHGGPRSRADQTLVLQSLQKDLPLAAAGGDAPAPRALLVTGDIAATGGVMRSGEYKDAMRWLEEMRTELAIERSEVHLVPGNHDIAREPSKSTGRQTISTLRRGGRLDSALEGSALPLLRARQRRFWRACAPYGRRRRGSWPHWMNTQKLRDGRTLRLVGLNTALLCLNDHDSRKLEVGSAGLVATLATPQVLPGELVIVLGHHPLEWLRDEVDAFGWIRQRAHAYLCGHIHDARSFEHRSGSGLELVTVVAGAAHEPLRSKTPARHSYNLSALGVREDGKTVLRVWARTWADSEKRFVQDRANTPEGLSYAEHILSEPPASPASRAPAAPARPSAARQVVSSEGSLDLVEAAALRESGSRRTAYPTDLSFQELVEQKVFVPPSLLRGGERLSVEEIADALRARRHVLILGDPGAGKSFLTYLTMRSLADGGATVLPVDLRDLRRRGDGPRSPARLSRARLLNTIAQGTLAGAARMEDDGRALILIADGIDELLSTGTPPEVIAHELSALRRLGTLLVSCRVRDYEEALATRLEGLDDVATMVPWSMDGDFAQFVGRLAETGRLKDPEGLLTQVQENEDLAELAKRPLYARMLTYVLEDPRADVVDRPTLYATYLRGLASAAESSLRRAGCEVGEVLEKWRSAAWAAHDGQMVDDDAVPLTPLLEHLGTLGVDPACAYRLLHALVDVVQAFDELKARFIHFSFYEYLVAEEAAARLRSTTVSAAPLGVRDLPVEIRHYLTAILNRAPSTALPGRIADSYSAGKALPQSERLTTGNLLVYILGRIPKSGPAIGRLLAAEQDDFLRSALYWAACGIGDESALVAFIAELERDPLAASLNRGYLRYYYGDLDGNGGPPFHDDAPHGRWASTRAQTLALMAAPHYLENVSPARQVLDVWTYLDFLRSREEEIDPDAYRAVGWVLETVGERLRSAEATAIRDRLAHRLPPTQLPLPLR
jgi:hypothetical protein